MSTIDLETLTDLVRELEGGLKKSPAKETTVDGSLFVTVSKDVWTSVFEIIYQVHKANDYSV